MNKNSGKLEELKLVVNIDGAEYKDLKSAISFYNLVDDEVNKIMCTIDNFKTTVKGEKWYEGDHSMFLQKGVPCITVTSSNVREVVMNISHTPMDTIYNVDTSLLSELVEVLNDIIYNCF